MPKGNFKSLSVEGANYETWFDYWEKNKKEYSRQGINSFSSFITAIINGYLKNPFGDKK